MNLKMENKTKLKLVLGLMHSLFKTIMNSKINYICYSFRLYELRATVQTLTMIGKEIEKRLMMYFDPDNSIKMNFEVKS